MYWRYLRKIFRSIFSARVSDKRRRFQKITRGGVLFIKTFPLLSKGFKRERSSTLPLQWKYSYSTVIPVANRSHSRMQASGCCGFCGEAYRRVLGAFGILCIITRLMKILHNRCLKCAGCCEGEKYLHKENRSNDKNALKSHQIALFVA